MDAIEKLALEMKEGKLKSPSVLPDGSMLIDLRGSGTGLSKRRDKVIRDGKVYDEDVIVNRPPEEFTSSDFLSALKSCVITDGHPKYVDGSGDEVYGYHPDNFKKSYIGRGVLAYASKNQPRVIAHIMDVDSIKKIITRLVNKKPISTSPCVISVNNDIAGVPTEKFVKLDHLAIVDLGHWDGLGVNDNPRAKGIRNDYADAVAFTGSNLSNIEDNRNLEEKMPEETPIDAALNKDAEADKEVKEEVEKLKKEKAETDAQLKRAVDELSKSSEQTKKLTAKVDELSTVIEGMKKEKEEEGKANEEEAKKDADALKKMVDEHNKKYPNKKITVDSLTSDEDEKETKQQQDALKKEIEQRNKKTVDSLSKKGIKVKSIDEDGNVEVEDKEEENMTPEEKKETDTAKKYLATLGISSPTADQIKKTATMLKTDSVHYRVYGDEDKPEDPKLSEEDQNWLDENSGEKKTDGIITRSASLQKNIDALIVADATIAKTMASTLSDGMNSSLATSIVDVKNNIPLHVLKNDMINKYGGKLLTADEFERYKKDYKNNVDSIFAKTPQGKFACSINTMKNMIKSVDMFQNIAIDTITKASKKQYEDHIRKDNQGVIQIKTEDGKISGRGRGIEAMGRVSSYNGGK